MAQVLANEGFDSKVPAKVTTIVDTPYFTPAQWDRLETQSRGSKITEQKWNQTKMEACSYIAAVGTKLGCPQRTMGTAQLLYQRFHLFYPPSDFSHHEVALACLFSAAKMNDTQKRLHEVVLTNYSFQFPELLPTPSSMDQRNVPADWLAHTHVSESDVSSSMIQQDQQRLLQLERLLLQCICFNFQLRSQHILRWTIKLAQTWKLSKSSAGVAWRVASDSHRTNMPLLYPPHTIAMGSLCVATALCHVMGTSATEEEQKCWAPSTWDDAWTIVQEDVDEVALAILELYASQASLVDAPHTQRAIPWHVIYPPPLGLLCLCEAGLKDLGASVTQAQIWTRQQIQTRTTKEPVSQPQQAHRAARAQDTLPSNLYRRPDDTTRGTATRYLLS